MVNTRLIEFSKGSLIEVPETLDTTTVRGVQSEKIVIFKDSEEDEQNDF